MFEDDFADVFRFSFPYYILISLPILLICFPNAVLTASDFTVQRMSQYDVNGVGYGCRVSTLNLEARSLYTWSSSRHCVVTKFEDITIDQFQEIKSKAGGLILLLPKNISNLSSEKKEEIRLLEHAMLSQEISIPIYFSYYNEELEKVIADILRHNENKISNTANNKTQQSALSEIITAISANGYQISASGVTHSQNKQSKIPVIQGELAPLKSIKNTGDIETSNNLPLIIIVAHLDTFGLFNDYLLNSDVAVALTLAELFSKLHSSINSTPKYRIMFLITESGALLNFQGVKKWLEENPQIQNVDFVLCLDTISQPIAKPIDSLYMHVSKPPKENTPMSNFYKQLKLVSSKHNISVEGIHKKINLAELLLGWEHERFSMKRYPAFTLSSLKSHKDSLRTTIFKDNNKKIIINTQKVGKILAEALARYIYNINENDEGDIFSGAMDVSTNSVKAWMQVKSLLHNNDLKKGFERHLKNVKIIFEKPDNKDPDFMLYEGQDAVLSVYRVKPAIFDLFLTIVIAAYLGCVYLVITHFPQLYVIVCKMSKNSYIKTKSN